MKIKSVRPRIIVATTALSLMLAMEWSGTVAAREVVDAAAANPKSHDTSTGSFYSLKPNQSIRMAQTQEKAAPKEANQKSNKKTTTVRKQKPYHRHWYSQGHSYLITYDRK